MTQRILYILNSNNSKKWTTFSHKGIRYTIDTLLINLELWKEDGQSFEGCQFPRYHTIYCDIEIANSPFFKDWIFECVKPSISLPGGEGFVLI
jgi:hypothetical protein